MIETMSFRPSRRALVLGMSALSASALLKALSQTSATWAATPADRSRDLGLSAGIATTFGYPLDPAQRTYLYPYDVMVDRDQISSCFQRRHDQIWHTGEDWYAPQTTPIYSVSAGRVVFARSAGWGVSTAADGVVIVDHTLPDLSHIYSMYGHLDPTKLLVARGARVSKGQIIAGGLNRLEYDAEVTSYLHWEMRYFLDGSKIRRAPDYRRSCNGVAGPAYSYPGHPDSFVANNGEGPTFHWTNPSAFVAAHTKPG